ncbi:A disintegrin and metalloproteinase with thrombospondin motifs adt-1-like [Topomyia yanbarensis]|uniref:A disintegrin and metalloproteinase with thrombospondin motifs adt-1-like n=1 Tax=Topomyia yanbarensis TaxID=2498891 RepID=UPI00273CB7E4|nr:A disintegrin and metalloproteinase with thrombospondin motifs adt-1-like [Topomyia yanbarensis]
MPVLRCLLVSVLLLGQLLQSANPLKFEELPHLMNERELSFYFGSEHRQQLPQFELFSPRSEPTPSTERPSENQVLRVPFQDTVVTLDLRARTNLVTTNTKFVTRCENGTTKEYVHRSTNDCHYLHVDHESSAAITSCDLRNYQGIVFLPNQTLEIQPLNDRLRNLIPLYGHFLVESQNLHLIKRTSFEDVIFADDLFTRKNLLTSPKGSDIHLLGDTLDQNNYTVEGLEPLYPAKTGGESRLRRLTIELGLFFDEAAYRIFAPHFDGDDLRLKDFILAYVNAIQALYHHPSLGTPVDITVVYLEIMKRQPPGMPHFNGERESLLDSFCLYQMNLNKGDDSDSNHWDLGLYVSGLDFHAIENGRRNGVTMGLATVGGICIGEYSCVIAEFGTTSVFGKPYPSAGFTSVFVSAHEIGHSLGMHHDSSGNRCAKDGYVMSPSRGTQGETIWSSCSAAAIRELTWAECLFDSPVKIKKELDAWKYQGYPGQVFTAKKQCEILLVDKDAIAFTQPSLDRICQNLQCRTPHRTGFYFSGPALEGTDCGDSKWCIGGDCVKQKKKPINVIKGGWSDWDIGDCNSGCLKHSRGFQQRTRRCDNPKPVNTDTGCEGSSFDVTVCDDEQLCSNKRQPIEVYASIRCREFSKLLSRLDPAGLGIQGPYDGHRLWMSCAIYCKRADSAAFYAPRFDLNDLGIDSYFPDGTLCHSDGTLNYYCQQHHCLPENFKSSKISIWTLTEDIPISGNALPQRTRYLDNELFKYLSIDSDGKPLIAQWNYNPVPHEDDGEWPDIDYRELPEEVKRAAHRL